MVRISEYKMGGDGATQGQAQRRAKGKTQPCKNMNMKKTVYKQEYLGEYVETMVDITAIYIVLAT